MKKNGQKRIKFETDSHRNYLVGAGLLVGLSSTLISGAYMKENKNLSTVASPIKELIAENKRFNSSDVSIEKKNNIVTEKLSVQNNGNYVDLSAIPYMKDITTVGWGTLRIDENLDGSLISLIVDGKTKYFLKGFTAHAPSTVAFDLTNYDYDYLTAYLGIDASRNSLGDGVRFEIHTSEDGINWTLKERVNNNAIFKGDSEAYFLKYPVKDIKYIKIVVQANRNNNSDHAVIAGAKLIKEGYVEESKAVDYIKTVEEYDSIIKGFTSANLTEKQELVLLQRNFVNNIGYDLLQSIVTSSMDYNETVSWLFNDVDNLRLYMLGGTPSGGNYYNSLKALSRLYRNYKSDFDINTSLNNKWDSSLTYGDLYKKMAITISLTHSANVSLWMQPGAAENQSDPVVRYAIYRYIHKTGRLKVTDNVDMTDMFEALPVEDMRFIMNNIIDDESILWLNDYVQTRIDAQPGSVWGLLTPHPYMSYVWPNYSNNVYYDEANKDYFNELFAVNDRNNPGNKIGLWDVSYTIPGGTDSSEYTIKITRGTLNYKLNKTWMNFRNKFGTGAVCGGISKTGTNIRTSHGIPATVIGQPGHAAILYYSQNSEGKGYWNIDNDVSGWIYSEKGERMLLGWGNDRRFAKGYTVIYMTMAQEALNRFDDYQKSSELLMVANSMTDKTKKEMYIRESLKALDFNIDAWYSLIELYNNDETKTEDDYYNLLKSLSEGLLEYPLPFYQLSALIQPKFTSNAGKFKYSLLVTDILNKGKVYNGTDVLQPNLTRGMASYLLGQFDSELATFSFDGDNAGKIVLSSRFDGNGIRWDYSLDGKNSWNEVAFTGEEDHSLKLSDSEISSITSANDIYIHIVGTNYSDENVFKIDILESTGLPATLYANDFENKFMGVTPSTMWKYNENDPWTYFGDQEPDLNGDRTIIVKAGATGVYLAGTEEFTFSFTTNNDPATRKYIPISHLSIESVSSEATSQGRYATNIIDGNIKTSWHSAWNGSDTTKEIVIKLDEIKNITALDYYPLGGGNGKIEQGQILVSTDGVNYTEAAVTNWTYKNTADVEVRTIDFEPVKAQYIKIVGKKTQAASSSASFIAGAMFNFYENQTVRIVANYSFDGDRANKIVLEQDEQGKNWSYSLDNGSTWKKGTGDIHELTYEEASSITVENGIKIRFDGDSNIYSINFKSTDAPQRFLLNDLENRLLKVTNTESLEWQIKGDSKWTSYSEKEPIVTGDKTLLVRNKAHANKVASEAVEYEFTKDNQSPDMKYVSIKHLSIHEYSTQSIDKTRPFYAPNVIDGDPDTIWHTDFRYSVLQQQVKPFVTIKLDNPRYISAIQFNQKKYRSDDPDYIKNGIVYVSSDGINWKEAGRLENLPQDTEERTIKFDESIYGQYVKVEFETYGIFASLANVNVYEDITKSEPDVKVEYSTTTKTNKEVSVKLVSDQEITINNNNGSDTYVFTENGTFIFEYTDAAGASRTETIVVDWIDKTAPVGTISYDTRDVTNEDVTVTLTANEPITITNNNGSNTYTFTENGEFEFEYVDEAGNIGTATASVTWISKDAPVGTLTYSKTSSTNQDVKVTLTVNKKVLVLNNNGSFEYTFKTNGSFTFEFIDEAGNRGTATATVDWIDKVAPIVNVSYDLTTLTSKDVIATISANEEIHILNNNSSNKHKFTENGEFTFEYTDNAGNIGSITAKVDWIDKTAPTAEISYSTEVTTSGEVLAFLVPSEKVTITNNNGSTNYLFTENGSFTFEFVDAAGNIGTATATVDWIDKNAPSGMIVYSTYDRTNKDVVVTLIVDDGVTITNNNGSNTYTFTENGTFVFEYIGENGLVGSTVATVTWIDKEVAKGTISYDKNTLTNKDVIATLTTDKDVTVLNNGGSFTHKFTENGSFTFEFIDAAGNRGTATAKVDWIDKISPVGTISYNIRTTTNGEVIATLTTDKEVTILNEDGKNTHVFTENGTYTFRYVDAAGNVGSINAIVDWIDKTAPKGTITYNTTKLTNKDIVATLTTDEGVTITNNNGLNTYTFTQNGSFVFEFVDAAGNVGTAVATVDWIDKVAPVGKIEYDITEKTNKAVTATLVTDKKVTILTNYGNDSYTFTVNGEFEFEFVDEAGNVGKVVAKVDWITDEVEKPDVPVTPENPSKPENPVKPDEPTSPETPDVPSIDVPVVTPDKPSQGTEITITRPSSPSSPAQGTTTESTTTTKETTSTTAETTTTATGKEEEETENNSKAYILWTLFIGILLVLLYEIKVRFDKRK